MRVDVWNMIPYRIIKKKNCRLIMMLLINDNGSHPYYFDNEFGINNNKDVIDRW